MKRIALLAVIGAGLMALPSTAAAQSASTCPGPDPIYVNPGPPPYACVNVNGAGGEIVINPGGCSYINGWETNPGTPGYAGICRGTTSRGPGCDPDPAPTNPPQTPDANTGGCFEVKGADPAVNAALNSFPVGVVTASFICGNTSGENPRSTTRDGCSIP